MDGEKFSRQLAFLKEIDKAKEISRNTILMDRSRKENDAEHMWHMAVCAMLFSEYADCGKPDMLRVLKMVLIHDIIEIDAGDTFVYDAAGCLDQHDRETKAADRIFNILPDDQAKEFRALWDEYEEQKTPEAVFTRLCDTFMPLYHNYETEGQQWRKLNVTSDKVYKRSEQITKGSAEIGEYVRGLIDDAVGKGYLKK